MLDEKLTIEYIRQAKKGDAKAKETLIENNVSLVKCIVKRYLGKGVDYDDLFQIACMGFLKAIINIKTIDEVASMKDQVGSISCIL